MADEAKRSLNEHAAEVASQSFDPSDYGSESPVSQGLAVTHEQANDVYTAGTCGHAPKLESGELSEPSQTSDV
ncbi:YozQ family protein [Paenibacillus hodogayensis]|uniref:YozQ family protein n=1 Tax=Paenibacillus hodogayensis TaxID=279208 RepID=A0ABV5VXG8_9BACL